MPPPSLTIGGKPVRIAIEDLGDSAVVESVSPEGPRAVVMFKCKYTDRFDVFRALMPTSIRVGSSIVRTAPFPYPPSPNLRCLSIGDTKGIKARVDESGWVTYDDVVFPAVFEIPKFQFEANSPDGQNDPSGQPWTTTKFSVSAEVVTPPNGAYYYGPFPNGKKIEEAGIGLVRANCEISMTRHFMPTVPLDETMQTTGFVNDRPIRFANRVFAKGCLLFCGMESSPNNDPGGNATQEVTYKILGKADDWNKFLSPGGTLQLLNTKADGTGTTPYTYFNFGLIP